MVLKDPRMISVWFFTVVLIIIVGVVSAEPWKKRAWKRERSARALNTACTYTYTAVQPNVDVIKEKVAEITVDRCAKQKWLKAEKKKRKKQRRKQMKKKQKQMMRRKKQQQKKNARPRTKTRKGRKIKAKDKKERQRLRRQRKLYQEHEEFRRWKSKISLNNLLTEPVAQDAITDLWAGLIERGPQWKQIYEDMHQKELPRHATHSIGSKRPEDKI